MIKGSSSKEKRSIWPKRFIHWQEQSVLKISIPFTWELPAARLFIESWEQPLDKIIVGGPGVYLMPDYFADMTTVSIGQDEQGVLQRLNPLATRTTLGCIRRCPFCAVGTGKVERGKLEELEDWPDRPIICDNNLLAASDKHFDRVIDRLLAWKWALFEQGLDARLLTPYHAERLSQIKEPGVRLALDSMDHADQWENAFATLKRAKIANRHIRSYALIAYNTGVEEAWERCQWIERHGIKVLPMWYHSLDALALNNVTPEQEALGWSENSRKGLMGFFWQHRGARPNSATSSAAGDGDRTRRSAKAKGECHESKKLHAVDTR